MTLTKYIVVLLYNMHKREKSLYYFMMKAINMENHIVQYKEAMKCFGIEKSNLNFMDIM